MRPVPPTPTPAPDLRPSGTEVRQAPGEDEVRRGKTFEQHLRAARSRTEARTHHDDSAATGHARQWPATRNRSAADDATSSPASSGDGPLPTTGAAAPPESATGATAKPPQVASAHDGGAGAAGPGNPTTAEQASVAAVGQTAGTAFGRPASGQPASGQLTSGVASAQLAAAQPASDQAPEGQAAAGAGAQGKSGPAAVLPPTTGSSTPPTPTTSASVTPSAPSAPSASVTLSTLSATGGAGPAPATAGTDGTAGSGLGPAPEAAVGRRLLAHHSTEGDPAAPAALSTGVTASPVRGTGAQVVGASPAGSPATGAPSAGPVPSPLLPGVSPPPTEALAGAAAVPGTGAGSVTSTPDSAPVTDASPAVPLPLPEQLVKGISPLLRGPDGTHRLTLHLEPEHLGSLRVQLALTGSEVSVQLVASDHGTREALRQQVDDLRAHLEELGLRSTGIDVATGGGPAPRDHAAPRRPPAGLAPTPPSPDPSSPSRLLPGTTTPTTALDLRM